MRSVFASTSANLSREFVEHFDETKLNSILSKVGTRTGVKINRNDNIISIVGNWPTVIEAHGILLADAKGLSLVNNFDENEENEAEEVAKKIDKVKPRSILGSSKLLKPRRNRPKTYRVKSRSNIPEPVIYYEYKDPMLVTKDVMSPTALVDVVNSVKNPNEAASLKKMLKEKYKKSNELPSEESAAVTALEQSIADITSNESHAERAIEAFISGTDLNEDKISEAEADMHEDDDELPEPSQTTKSEETVPKENTVVNIKVEKADEYPDEIDLYDGDTDAMSDAEVPEEDTRPTTRQTRSSSRRKGLRFSKVSRRKSTPKKYVAPNNVGVKSEQGAGDDGQPPVVAKKTKPKRKGRRKNEFPCTECDYVGKAKANLRDHKRSQHGTKYSCDQCEKTFGISRDLNRHKKSVHVPARHFCIECNKYYKTRRVYEEHIKSHLDGYVKPQFDCEICGKSFSSKYVLATHIKAEHLGMRKSYLCPTCGRSFTQKNSYRQHANVHAGIKPYVCDICGKAFSYEKSLKEHKFIHDGVRRFQCVVCEKLFLQSTSLRIHMKIHQENRDYICTSCGKGFTQKQALIRHERLHSGDKPFNCSLCGKNFSDYSIIRRHMILIHKKDPKNWQDSIVSHVKSRRDYYIKGGPGPANARHQNTVQNQSIDDAEYIAEVVDNALRGVIEAAGEKAKERERSPVKNVSPPKSKPPPMPAPYEKKTYCELENFAGLKPQDVSSYSTSSPFMAPPLPAENSQNVSAHNAAMPINYSIQPPINFSPIVTSGHSSPSLGHTSQESVVNRYQPPDDVHTRDFQHQRGFQAPDQLRSQIPTLHYPAPVTSDQGQSLHGQPLHNQWSILGYPPYYNPNFSQFQGPQN